MKCLMRMFAEEEKGVIFYETVISLKWQKHTFIECVPLPWAQFEEIPGYFKVRALSDYVSNHLVNSTINLKGINSYVRD